MVKKKMLITGGSGYIGSRLSLYFANKDYAITTICHSKIPSDEHWVSKMERVVVADIRDDDCMTKLAQEKFDVLIHLVSLDHYQSNQAPSFVSSINITPVWSLLDTFSKNGLSQFLYFSTAQVYGALSNEHVLENQILQPLNSYGLTHQVGELICDYYNKTSNVCCNVVRLSNSYGSPLFEDNNCWDLVINDLCKMAFFKKEIILKSDGSPKRDFIHGWDVCNAVEKIIEMKNSKGIYNLSSGNTLTILEIAQKIQSVYQERYHLKIDISAAISNGNTITEKYVIDNSLIKSIGFLPLWDIEMGINELFDYFENKLKNE